MYAMLWQIECDSKCRWHHQLRTKRAECWTYLDPVCIKKKLWNVISRICLRSNHHSQTGSRREQLPLKTTKQVNNKQRSANTQRSEKHTIVQETFLGKALFLYKITKSCKLKKFKNWNPFIRSLGKVHRREHTKQSLRKLMRYIQSIKWAPHIRNL